MSKFLMRLLRVLYKRDKEMRRCSHIGLIGAPVAEETTCSTTTPAIATNSMICSQVGVTNMGERCLDPLLEDVSREKSNSILPISIGTQEAIGSNALGGSDEIVMIIGGNRIVLKAVNIQTLPK